MIWYVIYISWWPCNLPQGNFWCQSYSNFVGEFAGLLCGQFEKTSVELKENMAESGAITLYGANGSPYSCKIRSYLRYKRIHIPLDASIIFVGRNYEKFAHIRPKESLLLNFQTVNPWMNPPKSYRQSKHSPIIQNENYYQPQAIHISNSWVIYWKILPMNGNKINVRDEMEQKIDADFGIIYHECVPRKAMRDKMAHVAKLDKLREHNLWVVIMMMKCMQVYMKFVIYLNNI